MVAALSLTALALLGVRQMNNVHQENLDGRIHRAGRAASTLMVERLPGTSVEFGGDGAPSMITLARGADLKPDPSWDVLLDEIGMLNEGAANLFRFNEETQAFDRFSTTFRTPDGARAGGSEVEPGLIAAGHPAFASLAAGMHYVGEVPVKGRQRFAYLTPIVASDDGGAGFLATDIGWVEDLERLKSESAREAFALSAALLLGTALIGVVVMFRSFRPLHRLTEAAHAIGQGDRSETIGLTERRDEIGYLARGLSKVADLQGDLEHRAHTDALTGIPNRAALGRELSRRFGAIDPQTQMPQPFALMIVDLDGFKEVNDGLGHQVGDSLLQAVATSMQAAVEPGEFIARLGGDEFAVLSAVESAADDRVPNLADRAKRAVQSAAETDVIAGGLTASIGIALIPEHGTTPDRAMRHADLALYEVKRSRPGSVLVYEERLSTAFDRRRYLVESLRAALAAEQLELEYQPLYTPDFELVGVEGLARWRDESGAPISPAEFIPVAEQSGLIDQIGTWALREACMQIASWTDSFGWSPRVAINVSVVQLRSSEFFTSVAQLLTQYPQAKGHLCLELTESVLMPLGSDGHMELLRSLARLGVCLAIDDFGTGYSSLTYLRELPVNEVKIDRAFVQAATEDRKQAEFLARMVELAKGLGLAVVLEGIETSRELELAQTLGCDLFQGFLFGRSMPPAELEQRFDTRAWVPPEPPVFAGADSPPHRENN